MAELFHLNCVRIVSPYRENVCGHCLLIREGNRLVLVDTGIGLADIRHAEERIGKELIEMVGYRFDEKQTAIRQMEHLGFNPDDVSDCIISHLDNDHTGGLADFPNATVHVGKEEYDYYLSGNPRYLKTSLSHNPFIKTYGTSDTQWFGFEARKVSVAIDTEVFLIPMFGHTLGHCGVAIKANGQWILYTADAYYLREELDHPDHPVNELAEARADDNYLRKLTLDKIRKLITLHPEIEVFGYHDINEFEKYI
ncbi:MULTISPECIES: MBL fold metallo-hydrolase [Chryseobacterium]|uniref:Glyoxylase-like metal-dependent hydrolase (Beta-lactamase superfamily II) n=1 Tax=Chryseobacterium camelliae TaxID=1265445 RepID=A0ABU0TGF9_9FLAO|nr:MULTISPECIES: MBL fold metallo-hydrolase [Chryseobacterium]MDT3406050.1 glyoxylase-like metal-dependent hydrolase (beta-lactamase superfamily II) [Pseudacidovorax intermedius]MDQ1096150.1 glyoxylase-like metal-dependent hydrolase (beta-lactamase superfamily II) [Chryseobacterium camelliae]MDQ1100086.1 glyoxylase-like metal-dependent hydrolase (beta-lactamase superfamily II) [Chryseobacterium sp. SORGH_AS_1048]MDR6087430.1 glyoxylase-like metal-dependent hydrolase (beta-lactamase superfamily 